MKRHSIGIGQMSNMIILIKRSLCIPMKKVFKYSTIIILYELENKKDEREDEEIKLAMKLSE